MKLLNKIKNSAGLKVAAASVSAAAVTALGAISVCATDGTPSEQITSALSTAFTTMQSDVLGYIVIVLPIALAVVGAFFGIKKAIQFFKSTASK